VQDIFVVPLINHWQQLAGYEFPVKKPFIPHAEPLSPPGLSLLVLYRFLYRRALTPCKSI
jgi:hypothetical protein